MLDALKSGMGVVEFESSSIPPEPLPRLLLLMVVVGCLSVLERCRYLIIICCCCRGVVEDCGAVHHRSSSISEEGKKKKEDLGYEIGGS